MSATLSLSRGYGSFFWNCTKFAVSPYTNTFLSIANPGSRNSRDLDDCANGVDNVISAAVVCGILTFVVPVLPILASFTFTFASIAMLLAVSSMFLTYPFAVLADACNPQHSSQDFDPCFTI